MFRNSSFPRRKGWAAKGTSVFVLSDFKVFVLALIGNMRQTSHKKFLTAIQIVYLDDFDFVLCQLGLVKFGTFALLVDPSGLLWFTGDGGLQRGDRDPVSRTNFNKIHASRFESVIVGETSGKRNFHDQTQIIHESRIPHEINHAPHAFRYSRIMFLFK